MPDPRHSRPYNPSAREPGGHRLDQARQLAARQRDAALDRIGSARRWVIAGAAGLSAAFAALVYALAPGHSLSSARAATPHESSSTSTTPVARGSQPPLPAPAGPGALGLNSGGGGSGDDSSGGGSSSGSSAPAAPQTSPAPAPAPAPSSPPVTSGGS